MTGTTKTATAESGTPKAAAKTKTAKTKAAPKKIAAQRAVAAKAMKGEKIDAKAGGDAVTKIATKPEATKKAVPDTRPAKPLAPHVVELIALLKTKKGATNEEAAQAIKGFKTARDVRAAIRDKVRKLHSVTKEHDGERGAAVFRIKS
jgi:hypothetical protein